MITLRPKGLSSLAGGDVGVKELFIGTTANGRGISSVKLADPSANIGSLAPTFAFALHDGKSHHDVQFVVVACQFKRIPHNDSLVETKQTKPCRHHRA